MQQIKKYSLVILLNLFIYIGLFAQYSNLISHDIVLEMDQTQQLLHGDFDNDGDIDLLQLFYHEAAWFENENNSFTTHHKIDMPDTIYIVDAAIDDFDNDGDLDLIGIGNYLFLYVNDGYGIFEGQVIYDNPIHAKRIAVGDLDSDKRNDIVLSDEWGGNIVWLKNYGDSPFDNKSGLKNIRSKKSSSAKTVHSIYIIDFDKNGTNDIILNNSQVRENRYWYSNTGSGNFYEEVLINHQAYPNLEIGRFLIIDFDKDGFYDLVGEGKNGPAIFENNGDNMINQTIELDDHISGYIEACADFNSDEKIDLVFSSFNERLLAWYEYLGDFSFAQADTLLQEYPVDVKTVLTIDYDQDGDADILSANTWDDKTLIYNNDGEGNFALKQTLIPFYRKDVAFKANDIDNDGDLDVFSGSNAYDFRGIWFSENVGKGVFNFQKELCQLRTQDLLVEDFNNDGLNDVLGASNESIFWLQNLGSDLFSEPIIIDTNFGMFLQMDYGDIDGNSYQDLIIRDFNSTGNESVFWYENTVNGFTSQVNLIIGDSVYNMHVVDMDQDGLSELVIGHADSSLYLYKNKGNATFDRHVIAKVTNTYAINTADLNNDGLTDILSLYLDAENLEKRFAWFESIDGINYKPAVELHNYFQWSDWKYNINIRTADFNQDDLTDITITSPYEGYLFFGHGNGEFSEANDFYSCDAIELHDMDEDDDPDYLLSIYGWYSLSWFENLFNSEQFFNRVICDGDSIQFFDQWYGEAGTYTELFNNTNGGIDKVILNLEVENDFSAMVNITGPAEVSDSEAYLYTIEGEDNTEYYWNVEGGVIESLKYQTDASIRWTQLGINQIEIYAVNPRSGCKTLSTFTVKLLEVSEQNADKIMIYPNPASNFLSITRTAEPIQLEFIDAAGRKVIVTTNEQPINVASLSAGIYIISLKKSSGDQIGWKKLMIY